MPFERRLLPRRSSLRLSGCFLLSLVMVGTPLGCSDSSTDPFHEEDPPGGDGPENPDEPSWLDDWVIPISTTDPATADLSDLDPFGVMVGDARLVGLGEGTHGTREFFLLKHRLIRHLVEEEGFRTVAFEAPWALSNALNRYVVAGEGEAEELVRGLRLWPWRTQEVVDLVEWMRSFNRARDAADQVRFAGFDMQISEAERDSVEAYLVSVDPADQAWVRSRYSCFWGANFSNWPNYDEAYRQSCVVALSEVHQKLVDERDNFLSFTSEEAYERALHAAQIVLWSEQYYWGESTRDSLMAENVKWLVAHGRSGERIALWAHNTHVSVDGWYGRETAMGGFLDQAFGSSYIRVGFSFRHGSFIAGDSETFELMEMAVGPPLEESVEAFLATATAPLFLLDLRELAGDPAPEADPIRELQLMRQIGSTYDPQHPEWYYLTLHLVDQFDLMVFVNASTPSTLL